MKLVVFLCVLVAGWVGADVSGSDGPSGCSSACQQHERKARKIAADTFLSAREDLIRDFKNYDELKITPLLEPPVYSKPGFPFEILDQTSYKCGRIKNVERDRYLVTVDEYKVHLIKPLTPKDPAYRKYDWVFYPKSSDEVVIVTHDGQRFLNASSETDSSRRKVRTAPYVHSTPVAHDRWKLDGDKGPGRLYNVRVNEDCYADKAKWFTGVTKIYTLLKGQSPPSSNKQWQFEYVNCK